MKNKILTITLLAMLILTFLCTSCFASTEANSVIFNWSVTGKDITIKLPSGYGTEYTYYYIVSNAFDNEKVNYYVYMGNSPFYFDGTKIICEGGFVRAYYTHYRYETIIDYSTVSYSEGAILDFGTSSTINSVVLQHSSSGISVSSYLVNPENIEFANHTIYEKTTNEVVFQGPQVEGVVAPLVKSIDFSETLKEILEIFPLVLMVLIGLLSLRKAIALMFQTFRAS